MIIVETETSFCSLLYKSWVGVVYETILVKRDGIP